MSNQKKTMFFIKLPYWLGIVADTLWAIGLFFPSIFRVLIGRSDYDPDLQIRLIMAIGGTLMAGWTILLIWAVMKPIERKAIILLTTFVVIGLTVIAMIGFIDGNTFNVWILIKNTILMIAMITSYILSIKMENEKVGNGK